MASNIPVNYNPANTSANAMQIGDIFKYNNNNNQFFVNYPPTPPIGPKMGIKCKCFCFNLCCC